MARAPAAYLVLFIGMLTCVAGWDLVLRRVPNALALAIAAAGVASRCSLEGARSATVAVLASITVALILIVPWRLGLMGGGDIKLAAAIVPWVYPERLQLFFCAAAIAGAVVTTPYYVPMLRAWQARAATSSVLQGVAETARQTPRRRVAPLGVGIAIGGVIAVLWR
jgi:prepilin peptidase CpaA